LSEKHNSEWHFQRKKMRERHYSESTFQQKGIRAKNHNSERQSSEKLGLRKKKSANVKISEN
jgi:hypothetical protein